MERRDLGRAVDPQPSGSTDISLSGVSCSSPIACTAVGTYVNSSNEAATFAERWNGKTWAVQSTPNPKGVRTRYEISLSGVSCPSATACIAVGYYANSAIGRVTLAERWNGKTWAIQSTPNPSGSLGLNYLYGVSCSSATACTAVGNYLNDSSGDGGTLAERWNGKTWAVQSTPNPTGPRPTGSKDSYLQSVSCSSATACTAVGYYGTTISYDPEADVTLAERWNGKSWAVQPTPKSPSGASNINL